MFCMGAKLKMPISGIIPITEFRLLYNRILPPIILTSLLLLQPNALGITVCKSWPLNVMEVLLFNCRVIGMATPGDQADSWLSNIFK